MSDLNIGTAGGRRFTLPIETAGEATAILAKRGAGKTNTAVVMVEELIGASVQVVILDPVGSWWGLRSSADGSGPGLRVPIVGGQHGDVPLEETAGKLLADVVVDTRSPMLIDLSDFPSKAAVRRFVADFAERLYRRKARQPSALHLVLEEADEFAPQRTTRGGEGDARMLGAIEQIVRRGRSRGLGMTMVTQRSAKLNKDVLTQADTLIAMRTTAPHDIDAVKAWVAYHEGGASEVIASLPGLETGEAWVWNPEHDILSRVRVRRRRTFDSSATPKPGETRVAPSAAAEIDLAALGDQIRATAEKAEANDPKVLRARVRELEAELRRARSEAGMSREEAEALAAERAQAAVASLRAEVRPHVEELHRVLANGSGPTAPAVVTAAPRRAQERAAPRLAPPRPASPIKHVADLGNVPAEGGELPKGERLILTAIAQHDAGVSREQLSVLTGYKRSSRDTYLQRLGARGLVDARGGMITATDAGVYALGHAFEPLPTGAALREHWLARLPEGERVVLEVVLAAYPDATGRAEISERTPYKRSSRDTYLQRLAARKLVTKEPGSSVRASDDLFDGGR